MTKNELALFLQTWESETQRTVEMIQSLPSDQYAFRPDPQGRSVGELAWHLAEGEGVLSDTVASGRFDPSASTRIPGLRRPLDLPQLLPAFRRVHADAVARVSNLSEAQLGKSIPFLGGRPTPVSELLWVWMLMANIHHRGQLSILCRLAGGVPPGVYGPNREEMAAFKAGS